MLRFWKKKRAIDREKFFPAENEFWLMRGAFRGESADLLKISYYGLPAFSTDAICPPKENSRQEQFYRLICRMTKELLKNTAAAVLVEVFSRSDAWKKQLGILEQRLTDCGGVIIEEHSNQKDSYAFVFSGLPVSFFEEVYWWMGEHTRKEDIYAQYSVLQNNFSEFGTVSEIKKATVLDISIDEVHPVLLLQADPSYSIKQVSDILSAACIQEGWLLFLKT